MLDKVVLVAGLWFSLLGIFVAIPFWLGVFPLKSPLFGSNSGLFTFPGFIVSLVGFKKKKKTEGRRDKKGNEEGIKNKEGKRRRKS